MLKKTYTSLDLVVLLNILLAAIILGAIAHELFHFLLISQPSELTIYWGAPNIAISSCCLKEGEAALEEVAYFIQFLVMVLWVALNFKHALEKREIG